MATLKTCDRCSRPIAQSVRPYRFDVSDGSPARDVQEQTRRRIHWEICATCAEQIVSFARAGRR